MVDRSHQPFSTKKKIMKIDLPTNNNSKIILEMIEGLLTVRELINNNISLLKKIIG